MTRITIEVNESGAVSTSAEPTSSVTSPESSPAAVPASNPFVGAINAGSAPELGSDSAPHLFIGSSTPPAGVTAQEAISAGAAPAHVFEMSSGGVA